MKINAKIMKDLKEFTDYFNSFYGIDGIYSHNRNYSFADIMKALECLFISRPDYIFIGDSIDREYLRDIMLESLTMIKHFETTEKRVN